jgi:TldD protein
LSHPWRVEAYDQVLEAALEQARLERVFLIGRLQDLRDWGLLALNGRLEHLTGGHSSGLGVQVFTTAGACGFASSDRLAPDEARRLVQRAAALARAAEAAGGELSRAVFELRPEPQSEWLAEARPFDGSPRQERIDALLTLHREALELAAGFGTRSTYGEVDEEWRIVRSDGTDLRTRMPRALARHSFTARGERQTASTSGAVCGADDLVLLGPASQARLQRRARRALARARAVTEAPAPPGGPCRIVLDHTLAKGLAHEAFGHAAETDIANNSILATEGRLRLGQQVARPGLSIVDGPLPGDYAWQPVSANGIPRQTVAIIADGVLRSGLGDLFSAERAGSPLTGAGRAEQFRSRPMPRMTNIRLVLERFAPLAADPDDLEPAEVRDLLRAAGLIEAGERTLLLSGYRGGQVSPLHGDFVFNCAAIYDLSDGASARQPALFSGRSLSALRAISGALGGLQLDAPGRCVKGSQGVATSGGSHAFVVLERHPEVVVGGA